MDVVAPDIDAVTADEYGIGVGVLVHGLLEELREVLLVGGVLDDGNAEGVVVAEVPLLSGPAAETLDLLDVVDLEEPITARALPLEQQRHQHGPLRVRVDTAAGAAPREGRQEQRCALRRAPARRRPQVYPAPRVRLLR